MNQSHWENVYLNKSSKQVSWFQESSTISLEMLQSCKNTKHANIIDIGSGTSVLVSQLINLGFANLSVLDISQAAINKAKLKLGDDENKVSWLCGDITEVELKREFYDIWHDRAVFHFLTQADKRQAYIEKLKQSLKPGGNFIIATFELEGPEKCSGLPVVRYDHKTLEKLFSENFKLISSKKESHLTPFDTRQEFIYCHFQKTHA